MSVDYWKATVLAHQFNTYLAQSGDVVREVDRELRGNLFFGKYDGKRFADVQRMVDYLQAVSNANLDHMQSLEEEARRANHAEGCEYYGVVTAYSDTVRNLAIKLYEADLADLKELEADHWRRGFFKKREAVMEHLGLVAPTVTTPEELEAIDFRGSAIVRCRVTGGDKTTVITEQTECTAALVDVWATMCAQKVLQNTSFDFKLTDENGAEGFHWSDALRMSFRRQDATATMREIRRMVELNGYSMDMTVRLRNGSRVRVRAGSA